MSSLHRHAAVSQVTLPPLFFSPCHLIPLLTSLHCFVSSSFSSTFCFSVCFFCLSCLSVPLLLTHLVVWLYKDFALGSRPLHSATPLRLWAYGVLLLLSPLLVFQLLSLEICCVFVCGNWHDFILNVYMLIISLYIIIYVSEQQQLASGAASYYRICMCVTLFPRCYV